MKPRTARDGKHGEVHPSTDQFDVAIEPTEDPAYGDAFQGIEFLDDAIRMEDHVSDQQDSSTSGE